VIRIIGGGLRMDKEYLELLERHLAVTERNLEDAKRQQKYAELLVPIIKKAIENEKRGV